MTRLVLTLNAGQDALTAAVRPSHERYAAAVGAKYLVLTGRVGWPLVVHEKWRFRKYVAAFDRTLVIDTDAWVHPAAPDLFAEVPETHVGMSRTDPWLDRRAYPWRRLFRELCESQGVETPFEGLKHYWNCGVWVGSRTHADYWAPPPRPAALPCHWCDEEQWGRRNVFHYGYPVHDMDRRWNYQWYLDRPLARLPAQPPGIVHLSGMRGDDSKWRVTIVNALEYAASCLND